MMIVKREKRKRIALSWDVGLCDQIRFALSQPTKVWAREHYHHDESSRRLGQAFEMREIPL